MLCYTVLLCFCLVVSNAQTPPPVESITQLDSTTIPAKQTTLTDAVDEVSQSSTTVMIPSSKDSTTTAAIDNAQKSSTTERTSTSTSTSSTSKSTLGIINTTNDLISFKLGRVNYVLKNEDLESMDIFALEYLKAKLEFALKQNSIEDKQKALNDYNTLVEYFGLQSLLPDDDTDDYYDYYSIFDEIYDYFF